MTTFFLPSVDAVAIEEQASDRDFYPHQSSFLNRGTTRTQKHAREQEKEIESVCLRGLSESFIITVFVISEICTGTVSLILKVP